MDKIREKLVELLREVQYLGGLEEKIADHLIFNGVTVQRWIPVSERLPDETDYYLYKAEGVYRGLKDGVGVSFFMHKAKKWKRTNGDFVTHWMPLPEPPGKDVNGNA